MLGEATASTSAALSSPSATNTLGRDGRTDGRCKVHVFVQKGGAGGSEGRPTFQVKRQVDGVPGNFLIGLGLLPEHAPGPLPELKKRPLRVD